MGGMLIASIPPSFMLFYAAAFTLVMWGLTPSYQ